MRLLVVLAACGVPAAREATSTRGTTTAPAPAPPRAVADREPDPVPVLVTCPALPNAARGGIRLTWLNETPFVIDLCPALDRALGTLDLPRLQRGGFELATLLSTTYGGGQHMRCTVNVHMSAKHHPIGEATATAVLHRREDCIAAALADVMTKVAPALVRHVETELRPRPSARP